MGNRSERVLRKLVESFELASYSVCEYWGAVEWARALQFRHVLDVQLRHLTWPNGLTYGPRDNKFISSSLEIIRNHPTALEYINQSLDGMMPAVRDMTVGDFLSAYDNVRHAASEVFSEAPRKSDADESLMSQSIEFLCLARDINPPTDDRLAVIVDLTKTDDDLKKDFDCWLRTKRRCATLPIEQEKWVRFDKNTFRKWHRYRVLGCIDLELCAEAGGIFDELSDQHIADTLFPGSEPEQVGKIRRTIRPLAERILSWRTLSALITQARQ